MACPWRAVSASMRRRCVKKNPREREKTQPNAGVPFGAPYAPQVHQKIKGKKRGSEKKHNQTRVCRLARQMRRRCVKKENKKKRGCVKKNKQCGSAKKKNRECAVWLAPRAAGASKKEEKKRVREKI